MTERNGKLADLLIIVPPARTKNAMWPPYGAMYIASTLGQKGYNVQILNVDAERIANDEVVKSMAEVNPRYIGFTSMVATSYKYIKDLSLELRQRFPDKIQVLGGGLSNAAEAIFKNTAVDIVVHGEGEVTACEIMECLGRGSGLADVRGIYYRQGSSYAYTGPRSLIRDLDTLPYPAFDLVDMNRYLIDGVQLIRGFTKDMFDRKVVDRNRKRKMINILTNRGCIGSCDFCVRTDPGLRMPSIKYVFDFIEYCIEKFDVGFVSFGDECFAPNKARNRQFIEEYKRRKLDIIFRILGLRVDTVDKEILRAYKEIGCYMINYGYESGSQKMLNIIDKRISVDQNKKAIISTRQAGIFTPVQLILGMPGETNQTIQETIDSLKSMNLDYNHYKCTYALPMPGSPLYDFARLTGAIEDEDAYLSSLGEMGGTSILHVNLTGESDDAVGAWRDKIKKEMDCHYIYTKYKTRNSFFKKCIYLLEAVEEHMRVGDVSSTAIRKLRLFFYSILGLKKKKDAVRGQCVRFRSRETIKIESLCGDIDHTSVNRDMTLKKINERISVLRDR